MLNKNTFLIMNSSTSFSLFLFTYSPLLATLITTTCSSSLKPILFFLTSFIPTQEGKPFTLLLGQTSLLCLSSFSIPTLLGQAPILYTFSPICPWVEQHLKTSLEQLPPPTSYASTSISIMLHGWVHLEKSPPHDVATLSHYLASSWYIQTP